MDASGNGNDGTVTRGDFVQSVTETGVHGAAGNIGYVAGDRKRAMSWGKVIHSQFTICSVTRYTGPTRGRVLMGYNINWLHGHHHGNAAVAFYHDWKTSQDNSALLADPEDWVVLCGMNKQGADTIRLLADGAVSSAGEVETNSNGWFGGTELITPDGARRDLTTPDSNPPGCRRSHNTGMPVSFAAHLTASVHLCNQE